jgi:hypothetical protein
VAQSGQFGVVPADILLRYSIDQAGPMLCDPLNYLASNVGSRGVVGGGAFQQSVQKAQRHRA